MVALGIYLLIGLWLTGMPGHDIVHQMLNEGADQETAVFFLKWWPWAILHGQNPFVIRQLTWPASYDAAWMTSIAAPALIGAPVTLLLGPIATWNLWLLLAPVTAGMAMFVLLDTLEVPPAAAIVGGFIFGYSSFVVGEMEDHLFLTIVFPLPLLAALLLRRLRGQISPAWFVALSVLLASFLLYTSTEVFATATFAGLLGLLLLLAWYRGTFMRAARILAKELVGIVVGIAVFGAPLLVYALAHIRIASSLIQTPAVFSTNLLNYVLPTGATMLGGSLAARFVQFTGDRPEQGGYVGILLAILAVVAITQGCRNRRWAVPFAIWTVLLAVCTLGPQLHVGTTSSTATAGVPLPWRLAGHIPVLKDALPNRLMVFVFLGVATWLALWTSWARNTRQRAARTLALVAGAVLLLPNPGAFQWQAPQIPPAAGAKQLAAFVPPGTGLLVVPESTRAGALWSEATNFRVDATLQPRGFDPYSPSYDAWPLSKFVRLPEPPPGAAVQLEAFGAAHDDGAIAAPDSATAWVRMLDRLGWQRRNVSGVAVFRIPRPILSEYRHATPAKLNVTFYRTVVETLEKAGACYLRRGGTLASLDPATAVARHCLSPAFLGPSRTTPWTGVGSSTRRATIDNAWLGAQEGQVGVGLNATGTTAAEIFAHTPTPRQWLFYDPTARPVTLAGMRNGPQGTYMAVGPFAPSAGQG